MRSCRVQFGYRLVFAALLLLTGTGACDAAAISGVVRDSQGVAQMGAMVQVLSGSMNVATAFTDLYGQYRFTNLVPGKYQVRATAALFVPAMRANLRLTNGARATVNLTLSMLSDPTAWIPAERRGVDEPGDDWSWTMRAAANRPILRMVDSGQMVLISSSAADKPTAPPLEARAAVTSGDGGFGGGGSHNKLTFDRVGEDGSDTVVRTDIGTARTPYGRGPSAEMDAGYQRRSVFGGASRLVVSYQSHPEMMNAGGALGVQAMRLSSAERMKLGDLVNLEAGGTLLAVRTTGNAIVAEPFFRVSVHAGEAWTIGYRLATSRDVQDFDGLETLGGPVPLAVADGGRMQMEHGVHQEIAVSRKLGRGLVRGGLYQDVIDHPVIAGSGVMGAADLQPGLNGSSVMADTVTDSFELLGRGYATRGVSLLISEPVTPAIWTAIEYQDGAALTTKDAIATSLPNELSGMHAVPAEAVTAALKGRVVRSGTRMQASYRWQARRLVTPVAAYEAFSDTPYLSFYVRQAVRLGGLLPPGFEATVDVTNLLAQGYQPFLSADGRTLYLAQAPRQLQAGLSFTF